MKECVTNKDKLLKNILTLRDGQEQKCRMYCPSLELDVAQFG